jgi:Uma2 family endonuclease
MTHFDTTNDSPPNPAVEYPVTLPVTIDQYFDLVQRGHFEEIDGQVELIGGRIVRMNPQGPQHSNPLDILAEWSFQSANDLFRLRFEKPIVLRGVGSVPEPDIAWVERKSYARHHPSGDDVSLLIEASVSSGAYDTGEKCEMYARSGIPEYWQVNVPRQEIRVHRNPDIEASSFRTITTHLVQETISPLCLSSAALNISILFDNG